MTTLLDRLKSRSSQTMDFEGEAVEVLHMTPAQRLDIIERLGGDTTYNGQLALCEELITKYVVGMENATSDDIRNAIPDVRLQRLATLVMEANGMAQSPQATAKN